MSDSYDRRPVIAAGFSVKRLEPETVLDSAELEGGRTVGFKTPKHVSFAVIDAQGKVVKTTNHQENLVARGLVKP